MDPLNSCLKRYVKAKEHDDSNAPSWLLFHDTDEYIFPEDTSLTILQALEQHNDTCCAQVNKTGVARLCMRSDWVIFNRRWKVGRIRLVGFAICQYVELIAFEIFVLYEEEQREKKIQEVAPATDTCTANPPREELL